MNANPFLGFRSALRVALALLFPLLASLPTSASNVVGGGSNSGSNNSGSNDQAVAGGGEEVVGLPVTAADTSGLTFVGTASELRSLALSVQGRGRIDVITLPRGGVVVTFVGTYRLELDRAALARSNVTVLFRSGNRFTDGRARLEFGTSSSAFAAPRRLPLPLGRMAQSPDVQGDFLTLHLFGPAGDQAHVAANFGADRVTLFQRL